jgi:hypothetical protein
MILRLHPPACNNNFGRRLTTQISPLFARTQQLRQERFAAGTPKLATNAVMSTLQAIWHVYGTVDMCMLESKPDGVA